MRTGLFSVRDHGTPLSLVHALGKFEDEWRTGVANISQYLAQLPCGGSVQAIATFIKAEIRARFARGESVSVLEYLDRFPALAHEKDRVVSLVYEEYCLREERGEKPDTAIFCEQYSPWKDSLISQLRYHKVLSQVVGPALTPPRFPEPGDRFAQFQIRSEIGRGGAARVYLAEQTDMGDRVVALKVSADRGSEPSILGRLEHAHIVRVMTSARPVESNLLGLCMQFMPGLPLDEVIGKLNPQTRLAKARSLRDAISKTKAPPPKSSENPGIDPALKVRRKTSLPAGWAGFPERGSYCDGVAWVIKTLADALAYAHARNVLHLDVKPANVLLTAEDGPQLLDFNLAQDPHNAEQADAAVRGGTLPYMAPEQLEAFLDPALWKQITPAADIYALGLLASEMVTGRQPEAHDPSLPRARAIRALLDRRRDLRLDLRRDHTHVPHGFAAILNRCVAYEPSDRYRSANELVEDLELFLKRRPLKHTSNPSKLERLTHWVKRNTWPLAATFMLSGAILILSMFLLQERALNSAINDYGTRQFVKAGREFAALGGAKAKPIVRFYSAASEAKAEGSTSSLGGLADLLGSKADVKSLVEWGREHPEFKGIILDLSIDFKQESADKTRPEAERERLLNTAESLLNLALKIDSKQQQPRILLATIKESRGDFEGALTILDEVEAEIDLNPASFDARKEFGIRFTRTRNLVNHARVLSAPRSVEKSRLDTARECVQDAFHELEHMSKRFAPLSLETLSKFDYLRIEANLILSRIALQTKDLESARDFQDKSRKLLEKIAPKFGETEYFADLRKRINQPLTD